MDDSKDILMDGSDYEDYTENIAQMSKIRNCDADIEENKGSCRNKKSCCGLDREYEKHNDNKGCNGGCCRHKHLNFRKEK